MSRNNNTRYSTAPSHQEDDDPIDVEEDEENQQQQHIDKSERKKIKKIEKVITLSWWTATNIILLVLCGLVVTSIVLSGITYHREREAHEQIRDIKIAINLTTISDESTESRGISMGLDVNSVIHKRDDTPTTIDGLVASLDINTPSFTGSPAWAQGIQGVYSLVTDNLFSGLDFSSIDLNFTDISLTRGVGGMKRTSALDQLEALLVNLYIGTVTICKAYTDSKVS